MSTETKEKQSPSAGKDKPKARIVVRMVRHDFTPEERNIMGNDLAHAHGENRGLEAEFDQVKASYKSRGAEIEARIEKISTALVNGFDMREKRCRVEYLPKERRKRFFLEDDPENLLPVAEEAMSAEDFQADLIQAESKFENRKELQLFNAVGEDSGVLVVGRLSDRWFAALRIKVGGRTLDERLDSEQKSVKRRADAVRGAAKRAMEWFATTLGAEAAEGFKAGIEALVEAQKEIEE